MKASEILEAAEKNKVPKYIGYYYDPEKTAFCGLGLIRRELGLCGREELNENEKRKREREMDKLLTDRYGWNFFTQIVTWNDDEKLSFGEMAKRLRNAGL